MDLSEPRLPVMYIATLQENQSLHYGNTEVVPLTANCKTPNMSKGYQEGDLARQCNDSSMVVVCFHRFCRGSRTDYRPKNAHLNGRFLV